MATGGDMPTSRRTSEDFRHTCGLCMEPYRGRQPKILPCFHTFCLPCLTTLAASAKATTTAARTEENPSALAEKAGDGDDQGSTELDAGGAGVVLMCPTCRGPVTLPKGGVANLQTNFYLDDEDAGTTRKLPPCDMCGEGSQRPHATHACETCRRRMCRTCRGLHDMFMFSDKASHWVRSIGLDDQTTPFPPPKVKTNCPVHPDQPMSFHCQKCDVSICLHCKLTSHEGHVTQDLQAAARGAKEELAGLLVTAKKQIRVVEASLESLERDEGELTLQEQEVTQKVNARYDELIAKATRARNEFFDDLRKKSKMVQNDIRDEKAEVQNTLKSLSGLVKQATLPFHQDADVVMLRNDLRLALLSDDTLDKHNKKASSENYLTFDCDFDLSAADMDAVRAYIGKLRTPKRTPTVSLQLLARMVNSWDSEVKSLILAGARPISFFTSLRAATRLIIAGYNLIFQNIQINNGGGYDVDTGIFTAPVGGSYLFLLTLKSNSLDSCSDAVLKVNDNIKAHIYCTDASPESCRVTAQLRAGETACVEAGGGYYAKDDSTFCGALLHTLTP